MKRVSVFRRYTSNLCIPQLPNTALLAEIISESLLLPSDAYQILRQPVSRGSLSSLPKKIPIPVVGPFQWLPVWLERPQKGAPSQGYYAEMGRSQKRYSPLIKW